MAESRRMDEMTLQGTVPTLDSVILGHVSLGFDKRMACPPSVWTGSDPGCRLGSSIFRGLWSQTEQWALGSTGQKGYLHRVSRVCFDF